MRQDKAFAYELYQKDKFGQLSSDRLVSIKGGFEKRKELMLQTSYPNREYWAAMAGQSASMIESILAERGIHIPRE